MKRLKIAQGMTFFLVAATGCSSIVPISQRSIGGRPGELHVSGRQPDLEEKPTDVYVKRSNTRIEKKAGPSVTGSLFQDGDAANYLAGEAPLEPGRSILVKVGAKNAANKEGTGGPGAAPGGQPATGEGVPADLDAIIKSLPNLDAGAANPALVKQFKMTVTRVLDNGDFEAVYKRVSQSGTEANALEIKARIPRDAAVTKGDVSTADLADVSYFESQDGNLMTRDSSEWEDEYTLRMSGFSEARSQAALDLEVKRRQLDDAKKQVQTKLQTMGAERRQVAKERETLAKEKTEIEQRTRQMAEELEKLKATVKEQEMQLKENENSGSDESQGEGAASGNERGDGGDQ